MSDGANVEQSRAFAREQVERLLGLDEPDASALFELADDVLGERRAARCLQLVRGAPLTRRDHATASVASLILGTRRLGAQWWDGAGDELAAAGGDGALDALGRRMCDDCANERWGEPIGEVDMNSPGGEDRVALPAGATAGDVFVASWDPGCRVVVEVVDRDGVIGSLLGELRFDETADIDWAWAMASGAGTVRLPGEVAGTGSDPFAAALDHAVALRLRAWAGEHEADGELLGPPWVTRGDLWEARIRLGLPYTRAAEWYPFEIVAVAAVDGDDEALAYALARLEMN